MVKGSQDTSWVRLDGEEGLGAHGIKEGEDYRAHRIREEGVKGSQDKEERGARAQDLRVEKEYYG